MMPTLEPPSLLKKNTETELIFKDDYEIFDFLVFQFENTLKFNH